MSGLNWIKLPSDVISLLGFFFPFLIVVPFVFDCRRASDLLHPLVSLVISYPFLFYYIVFGVSKDGLDGDLQLIEYRLGRSIYSLLMDYFYSEWNCCFDELSENAIYAVSVEAPRSG